MHRPGIWRLTKCILELWSPSWTVLLHENPGETLNDPEIPDDLKEPIHPEEIGKLYEYWRGFRPSGKSGTLVQCIKSKRNQGLFYTPERVVQFIVERTLDHLESNGSDLPNIRICDPAVGTGAFLAEAVDSLTTRVRRNNRPGTSSGCPEEIRSHIVQNCLFGVDLDPIAVKIAKAVLIRRIGQRSSRIIPNVRGGNALIGRLDSNEMYRQQDLMTEISENRTEFLELPDVFHWPAEFPEVFSPPRSGFDAVIGNPPYEIVSVKESGIASRSLDQAFFRKTYETCTGKINTYRLMMERGLQLLREGGILGVYRSGNPPGRLNCRSASEHDSRPNHGSSRGGDSRESTCFSECHASAPDSHHAQRGADGVAQTRFLGWDRLDSGDISCFHFPEDYRGLRMQGASCQRAARIDVAGENFCIPSAWRKR